MNWPVATVALALSACVSVRFDRHRGYEPVADAVLDDLRTSGADFATCLQRLGAPNVVFEQPDGRFALAWAWIDQFGWGIDASLSLRGFAVSGDFAGEQRNLKGVVLFFDRELRLVEIDRGLLHEFLRAHSRPRPGAIE